MSRVHHEMHIVRVCLAQERDYPNSPIDIHRPIDEQGWWTITLGLAIHDDKIVGVRVGEVRKADE